MSLQDSTFNTSHILDNEIIKANDFEFAFEKLIENVAMSTQMMLESTQDFVINGKVVPYQGMNVKVSPIYGVCKSTGLPFGRTELSDSVGFEESTAGRIDIIEVKGEWETYDNQQRAFNDPDTDTQTYQYVDTKKLLKPVYVVKKGEEGASIAPEVDNGYVKLAEVVIRANNSTILESDIMNITADIAGMENDDWSTEKDITYNIGYISDVNARFRVQHNEDGTHADDSINSDSLDIGIGAKQVNAGVLPVGGTVTIPTQTISNTDSILSVITKVAAMITSFYNAYIKYGTYGFKGEISISAIADGNNDLTQPLKLSAAGDGTAIVKIGTSTILSIDANGKLSTNGYTATSANHIVTKAVTDAISTALSNLTTRVENIENTSDSTVYSNGVLSTGTDGRYNVDNTSIYAATTQNVTLSGSQVIDGTTPVDGVYILVKEQTDAKENGIYQYSSNSVWSRVSTYLSPATLKAKIFSVTNGTVNGKKMFYLPKVNFVDSSDFGSDDILFSEYFGSTLPVANRAGIRDSNGCLKTNDSQSNKDCVNRGELITYNSSIARAMLDYIYPIGSLYWSSNSTDPGQLFGGTWSPIKDCFVWAKGDSDTVNATGGAKTVTLQTANLPSHHHSVGAHSHGLNSHTHTLNSGNTSSSGTKTTAGIRHSGNTGGMSANSSGTLTTSGRNFPYAYSASGCISLTAVKSKQMQETGSQYDGWNMSINVAHTHSMPSSYIYGSTDAASGNTANSSAFDSGDTGSGTAVNVMNPYIVKYCWERTA
jgi:hypothetical protein